MVCVAHIRVVNEELATSEVGLFNGEEPCLPTWWGCCTEAGEQLSNSMSIEERDRAICRKREREKSRTGEEKQMVINL